MKNILFIAYEFPPLNSGGSHRPYRFVKYLKEFGINPVVVTTQTDEDVQDNSWQKNLHDIEVIRTPVKHKVFLESFFEKQYINILDTSAKKWEKSLFEILEKLTKEIDFQAMYVTAPPFSIADLGVKISKKYDLPLILDMRDHWSHWNITPFTSYLHYRLILRKENQWFQHSCAVLAVSDQMIEDFKNIHPNIDTSKFWTIKNSFEHEIEDIPSTLSIRKATEDNPLLIGYVGSFYYNPYQRKLVFDPWWKKKPHQWLQYTPRKEDWLYRSPYYFFKTLSQFIQKYPDLKKLFRVEFIGAKPEWLEDMITEFQLEDYITLKGFLPHKESIAFQQSCDALLGTSMKVIGGRDYCIAGKSYEYISQKKPILAFMTEGTQKEFFQESGASVVFDADNTDDNVELFKKFILGEIVLKPNKEFIKSNYAKETTKLLADIVKKVIKV